MSLRRSLSLAASLGPLAVLASSGCGPDPFPTAYLGAVDGGSSGFVPPPPAPSHGGLPAVDHTLAYVPCPPPSPFTFAAPAGSAFGGLAASSDRIYLALAGHGYSFDAAAGCPTTTHAGPYGTGLGALGASGERVWAASPTGVAVLSPEGAPLGTCATTARALAVDPASGSAYAIDGKKWRILTLAGADCAITEQSAGHDLLAVAASSLRPGTLWLALRDDSGKPRVQRFDGATGAALDPAPLPLPSVCDLSGLAEVDDRLVVADPSCARVWSFAVKSDGSLAPLASVASTPGTQPVAIVAAPLGPHHALVAERAAPMASSAVVQLTYAAIP